jgi:hypothetical protein
LNNRGERNGAGDVKDATAGEITMEVTVGVGEEVGSSGLALTWVLSALSPAEPTAETV